MVRNGGRLMPVNLNAIATELVRIIRNASNTLGDRVYDSDTAQITQYPACIVNVARQEHNPRDSTLSHERRDVTVYVNVLERAYANQASTANDVIRAITKTIIDTFDTNRVLTNSDATQAFWYDLEVMDIDYNFHVEQSMVFQESLITLKITTISWFCDIINICLDSKLFWLATYAAEFLGIAILVLGIYTYFKRDKADGLLSTVIGALLIQLSAILHIILIL